MKIYKGAPGFPTRGFRDHVPMAPEPGEGGGGAGGGDAAAVAKPEVVEVVAPAAKADDAKSAAGQDAKTEPEDIKATLAALKAEREVAIAKNAELEALIAATKSSLSKERKSDLRAYVRGMSLAVPMSDELLDTVLGPLGDVDVRSEAGRAAVMKWRESNSTLFLGVVPPKTFDVDKEIESIVGGKENVDRKIFGGRAARSMIEATKKSDFATWRD